MARSKSEVKGVWFVTARAWVAGHGEDALGRVLLGMDPEWRPALTDPLTSGWYAEEALQQALRAMRRELSLEREHDFLRAMRECTEIGISRFFRALVRLSSPPFVLRQVPTMWRQIRRGAGRVEVETLAGRSIIHYREFPYFDDENYRLLTRGSLEALTSLTAPGRTVRAEILGFWREALDVSIEYG